MTAFNFPASPTFGQTYTAGGVTYTWDGTSWYGQVATLAMATSAQWLADVAGLALITDRVWGAAGRVTLTYGATITPDLSTFINATVTLTGNTTLANPTNAKDGQTGLIEIFQDATGSRTMAFGTNWKWLSGVAPVLSTTPNERDVLFYQVLGSAVFGSLAKAVQ